MIWVPGKILIYSIKYLKFRYANGLVNITHFQFKTFSGEPLIWGFQSIHWEV